MAATKNLSMDNTEHNGDTLDYRRSDMEDNYDGTLDINFPSLGKNDSLKSTRSLSVFRDPNASKTMARSEEMTYNIYEDFEGVPSTSAKAGSNYSKSETSRQRGTFQVKTATSSNAVPAIASDSLRNADFKANLASTLSRRLSSEGNTSGGSGRKQNGVSHLVSMDPAGRSSAKALSSVSNTLESTGKQASRNSQRNSLSSASSTSTLMSFDGVGTTDDLRGTKSLAELSQSETETDIDREIRLNSGRRSGYSSDQDSEVISHSLPRYSPAEIDVSNSKVKDKNFMAKMAAILSGSGTTSPVTTNAPNLLVQGRKGIEKADSSDNDMFSESRMSTFSRDLRDVGTSGESQHSTLEGRASDARSQRSMTPSDLRDVITQGKVNRLASELAIRGVPLTGRSTDAVSVSSMERQPSRASNQSEGRTQSKKFKYEVEGIDRPSEGETNMTTESDDDDSRMEQKHKISMTLLQDIRNRGKAEPNTKLGNGSQADGRSDDDHVTSERENSPALEIRGTTTAKPISTTSTYTVQSSDTSVANNIDQRSTQSESEETDETLEDEPPLQLSSVGSTQMAGRSTTEATSVSVEITDGSETGLSYNLEDAVIRQDEDAAAVMQDEDAGAVMQDEDAAAVLQDEDAAAVMQDDQSIIQDDNESITDDPKSNGRHVVTLHLTADNDSKSNDTGSLQVDKEATVAEKQGQRELGQREYSSSASGEDSEQKSHRHRMTNADRIQRTSTRLRPDEEPNKADGGIVLLERNARDRTLDEQNESQLTDGSDYSGHQRGKFGGRAKIIHKASSENTSKSYVPLESQRPKATAESERGVTSSPRLVQSQQQQQPTGRKIIITGRDHIRRITPMNDFDRTVQNGNGRGELRREFSDDSEGYPQPAPRKNFASDDPNVGTFRDRSQSFDRQVTNESGVHVSFSSDDSPEIKIAHRSPVWARPSDQGVGTRPEGSSRGVKIQFFPDRDVSFNSRRSLTDSERGRTGIYEQNRRRSRQRRASRQVTDSSLTDQEDFDTHAGHRSSVMRRRMKRHISRLSVESDTEDPAICSEPEYVHRESHVTKTSSTPVTGLITYDRSSSRPIVASEITRSPSVPPPITRVRPASAVQMSSHRSVTPVTGRISVPRTISKTNLSRSVTPMAGYINIQNGSRPRSAQNFSSPANYPNVINNYQPAYPPTSPASSSYLRSVNVVSPDSAEVIGVDPELRDAHKTGNIYHITMSIRPIMSMSRPGSVVQTYELVDTAIKSVPRHSQSTVSNVPRNSWLLTEGDLGFSSQSTRPSSSVNLSSNQQSSSRGHSSPNQVAFHLELHGGETIMKETVAAPRVSDSQRIVTGGESSFGKSVDAMEGSAVEDRKGSTGRRHSEKLPNIVRGNILIKNTFDTMNPLQVIDVVETDDDDDATVIEENNNMFHGQYRLRKENPVYSSNPDLHKSDDDDDVDNFLADLTPATIKEPERSQARMKVDRDRIGKGVMRTQRTGDQAQTISDSTQRTDYIIPDELEFESMSQGNRNTTATRNHRESSDYVDGFDRDLSVTRENRKDRSKAFLVRGGNLGQVQNGEASSSLTMNGVGSMSGVSMARTSQFSRSTSSEIREQNKIHDPYNDEDFDTEVKVNRDYWQRQRDRASSGQTSTKMTSSFVKEHHSHSDGGSLFAAGQSDTLDMQSISSLNIRSLMVGTSSSVKQTIKVDRLEDEILKSLPTEELRRREAAGLSNDSDPASALLDFDKVSEQVDMDISDGKVVLTSRARSERTVPIMGSDDMYKKSAVIVTKCIEIDMTLTPQRRQLYEMITSRQNGLNDSKFGTLDKRETFELYRKFAALADLDRAIAN